MSFAMFKGLNRYFYLRVPNNWGNTLTRSFLKLTKNFIQSYRPGNAAWKGDYESNLEIQSSYNFYGYNYDHECDKIKKYNFVKICFQSYGDMRKCTSAIQSIYQKNQESIQRNKILTGFNGKEPIVKPCDPKTKAFFIQENNCDCVANLYESKIHPMLRFIHEKDIQPCGWVTVKIDDYYLVPEDQQMFNVDIEINNLPLKYSHRYDLESTAGFITASFDIECDSSHGDFPNPKKDFKKPAIDIHESYFRISMNMQSYVFKKKFILQCVKDAFEGGSENIQSIYTLNGEYSKESFSTLETHLTEEFIEKLDNSKTSTKTRETIINELTDILTTYE